MTLRSKICTVHDKLAKKSMTEEFNHCYKKTDADYTILRGYRIKSFYFCNYFDVD